MNKPPEGKTPWTPGPWRYNGAAQVLLSPPTVDYSQGYIIAKLRVNASEQRTANGLLIAEAPAMATALIELVEYLAGYCAAADSDDPAHEVLERDRAILARIGAL